MRLYPKGPFESEIAADNWRPGAEFFFPYYPGIYTSSIAESPFDENANFDHFDLPNHHTNDFGLWHLFPTFYLNVKKWRIQAYASFGDMSLAIDQEIFAGDYFDRLIFNENDDGEIPVHDGGIPYNGGPLDWYYLTTGARSTGGNPYRFPKGVQMSYRTYKTIDDPDWEPSVPPIEGEEPDRLQNSMILGITLGSFGSFRWNPDRSHFVFVPYLSISGTFSYQSGSDNDLLYNQFQLIMGPSGEFPESEPYHVLNNCTAMGIPLVSTGTLKHVGDDPSVLDITDEPLTSFSMTSVERYGPDEW